MGNSQCDISKEGFSMWPNKNEIRLCGSSELIESRIELTLCKLFATTI